MVLLLLKQAKGTKSTWRVHGEYIMSDTNIEHGDRVLVHTRRSNSNYPALGCHFIWVTEDGSVRGRTKTKLKVKYGNGFWGLFGRTRWVDIKSETQWVEFVHSTHPGA